MSKPHTTSEKTHKDAEEARRPDQPPEPSPPEAGSRGRGGSALARSRQGELSPWAASSPFSFMRRFGEEMDRLFDDFGFGAAAIGPSLGRALAPTGAFGRAAWSPQVEMFEREGKLVIRADLPGLKREDIKVDLEDDAITIQGERRKEHEEKGEGFYRSERSYGSFYRVIPLPPGVNGENAKARFRDGVLEIEMEAPKQAKGRSIEIDESAEG